VWGFLSRGFSGLVRGYPLGFYFKGMGGDFVKHIVGVCVLFMSCKKWLDADGMGLEGWMLIEWASRGRFCGFW